MYNILVSDIKYLVELKDGYKIAKLNFSNEYGGVYCLLNKSYNAIGPAMPFICVIKNLSDCRFLDELFGGFML